jgi:hypothetical protein
MISGIMLEKLGWQRKGSTYIKAGDKIVYDGCDWFLNGIKVFNLRDIK